MSGGVRALLIVVSLLAGSADAGAQHFGRNKVEYVDFDFKIFETQHFSVYHYSSEEEAARIAARMAERWYARLSRVLGHELRGRQPLILYGSQPEFAQTNVVNGFLGEGIGGVTESARRRIVMPFAPTLAETDRILGHELTHAFQFDMARRYRGGLTWPLWSIEGLAQYLALGADDVETGMWLRDAVRSDLLPDKQRDAARKFSPYRYGHAFWAYLAGRFGDQVVADILKARDGGGALHRRIRLVTGTELDQLYEDWRTAAYARYGLAESAAAAVKPSRLLSGTASGRLYLGPSLSPDGRKVVFFSEKDRLSLDLFLADTASGTITRKLATTAAAMRFESLQAIRSSGSWSPEGDQFAFGAVENGQPALVLLDMTGGREERQVRLPQFGQVFTPSWSPDGRTIAFSALEGGVTNLYTYELATKRLRKLTDDAFADLQPEWSPDGRRLAFVTDRFSSDLASLDFGVCQLAILDVASGEVTRVPVLLDRRHGNPQWSPDGRSLYFVADTDGASNVFRLEVASSSVHRVTDVATGVTGLVPTSPALSVARSAPVLAFSVYRKGKYELEIRRGEPLLAGEPLPPGAPAGAIAMPAMERADGVVRQLLADPAFGLPEADALAPRAYVPNLFLEAMGPPYISSGGGPFGTFVRGGGSLLFSDVLGERKLAMFAQVGNRLRDFALGLRFVNRERRWNWGAVAEVQPSVRRLPRTHTDLSAAAVTRETHYFERTQLRFAGIVAYPLDQARRFEVEAGARHTIYRRSVSATVRSLRDGSLLDRSTAEVFGGMPATVGEVTAAYVRDTAIVGPTSPILGVRSRFEVTSTFGDLSATRVLLDHRRYMMPVRPYTLAARLVHLGQYGPDAADVRLLPTFLGSRQFLRGYGWNSLRCQPNTSGECGAFEELLGSRLLVANLELRAPLTGVRSRDLRYGPVPLEGFVFADSGLVWARSADFAARGGRRLVSSIGAGVRVNAFGFPLEFSAVRATDFPSRGWSFDFSFRPGF
jgi:Tol biopolymer transport system component